MRNLAKKKAHDARRHTERMASDLDYRMRKLFNTIVARCKPDSKRPDWEWYGKKGLEVTLTIADLKVLWLRDGAARMIDPTIDREKSDLGYSFENCRFIERADNLRRMIPTRRKRRWHKKPVAETENFLGIAAQKGA